VSLARAPGPGPPRMPAAFKSSASRDSRVRHVAGLPEFLPYRESSKRARGKLMYAKMAAQAANSCLFLSFAILTIGPWQFKGPTDAFFPSRKATDYSNYTSLYYSLFSLLFPSSSSSSSSSSCRCSYLSFFFVFAFRRRRKTKRNERRSSLSLYPEL
jgi:hypothetical protein